MIYFKQNLPIIFKNLFDNQSVVLDIETYDLKKKEKNQINRIIYNIGVYNIKKNRGISITVKESIEKLIKSDTYRECDYIKKYYDNLETSFLMPLNTVKQCFTDTIFKKIIGYNIINFDMPVMKNNGISIKTSNIIDLYFLVSQCLPKKYLDYCLEHNLKTEKNNPSFNAEAVYNFICGNNKTMFEVERHTALYDCIVEAKIYKYCKKRVKTNNVNISNFNYLTVWKQFKRRFKKIDWHYNCYFNKI